MCALYLEQTAKSNTIFWTSLSHKLAQTATKNNQLLTTDSRWEVFFFSSSYFINFLLAPKWSFQNWRKTHSKNRVCCVQHREKWKVKLHQSNVGVKIGCVQLKSADNAMQARYKQVGKQSRSALQNRLEMCVMREPNGVWRSAQLINVCDTYTESWSLIFKLTARAAAAAAAVCWRSVQCILTHSVRVPNVKWFSRTNRLKRAETERKKLAKERRITTTTTTTKKRETNELLVCI